MKTIDPDTNTVGPRGFKCSLPLPQDPEELSLGVVLFQSSESLRLGALWPGTLAVGLLDADTDLALVEQLRPIRVLVHVGFLNNIFES